MKARKVKATLICVGLNRWFYAIPADAASYEALVEQGARAIWFQFRGCYGEGDLPAWEDAPPLAVARTRIYAEAVLASIGITGGDSK